ncbi:MAG TPA: ATP-binding cassette domain-containing protein [Longimicrobiales bacterium]
MNDTHRMSDGAAPVIEVRGLSKRYGEVTALSGLDLVVPRGATYGLLGPNGAGKTTAIRMLLRIIEPDAGQIRLFGGSLSQGALDRIGYLPEERGLYKRMRVRRLLTFMASLKGMSARDAAPRITAWLERLGLGDRGEARLQELSKGNQQKIQFVSAVLHEPELVILDEPFSGLDVINQQVLKEIVLDLKRQGRTIVFCTHMIEQAEKTCDHVCILSRGEKVVDGPISDVRRNHGGEYVAIGLEQWSREAVDAVRGSRMVAALREEGHEIAVTLRPAADAQALLEELLGMGVRLRRFERVEPSLEQIFLERVGVGAAAGLTVEPEVAHV